MAQLEREIMIDATPETIFPLLTTTEGMLRWEGTEGEIDARPGGVYRILVAGAHLGLGEFVEVVPNEKVRFTFGWDQPGNPITPGSTEVEITLHPEGSKTLRAARAPRPARRCRRPTTPRAGTTTSGAWPWWPPAATPDPTPCRRADARELATEAPCLGRVAAVVDVVGGSVVVVVEVVPGPWSMVTGSSVPPSTAVVSVDEVDDELELDDELVVLSPGSGRSRSSGGSGKSSTSRSVHRHGHVALPDLGGEPAAGDAVHRRRLRVADPHHRGVAGHVAGEPGVDVVLGGAGLAGGRTADVGGRAGAGLDHAAERLGDGAGHVGIDGVLLGLGPVGLPEHVAVTVLDPDDGVGLDPGAVVGVGEVRAGEVLRADLLRRRARSTAPRRARRRCPPRGPRRRRPTDRPARRAARTRC